MADELRFLSRGALDREHNEDVAGGGKDFLFVIDGATGLTGENVMGRASDACWLAEEMAAALQRGLPDQKRSVGDILEEGLRALAARWPGDPEAGPSAGLAVWRRRGDRLEYYGLGDCDASLLRRDGTALTWREEKLTRLDARVLEEMTALCRRTGCTMAEARQACTGQLLRNRQARNTEEGYWCLDLTGKGLRHARQAELPLAECRSVFACTDGFAQLIQFGAADSLADLHRAAEAQELPALLDRLYALQEADRDMLQVPRFKFRDDASAALMRWAEPCGKEG